MRGITVADVALLCWFDLDFCFVMLGHGAGCAATDWMHLDAQLETRNDG